MSNLNIGVFVRAANRLSGHHTLLAKIISIDNKTNQYVLKFISSKLDFIFDKENFSLLDIDSLTPEEVKKLSTKEILEIFQTYRQNNDN